MNSRRLATSLCGVPLSNPVLAASGTYGYGLEFATLVDLNLLGGIVVKGLSREPMPGNPPPRLYETETGMINSVGLQNIGARVLEDHPGPAIKPIALRMVYQAAQAVGIPVVGLGGIGSGVDAAEFLIAGASAVQVGTASFWDPRSPLRVARELDRFLQGQGTANVRDLVGTLKFGEHAQ
jgi:dihydroorotate dehydrogenase